MKIGIIGDYNLTNNLIKKLYNDKADVININTEDIIFKNNNINLDVLIVNDLPKQFNTAKKLYLPKSIITILNSDIKFNLENLIICTENIITFGYNHKASVTISSVNFDYKNINKLQCCIQRNIKTYNGNTVLEQEFPIYVKKMNTTALGVVSLALLSDIKTETLKLKLL